MLNNLVNRHDAGRVVRKLTRGDLRGLIGKLGGSSSERVVRQWSVTAPPPTQWFVIPAVRRRWNRLVSGDETVDFPAFAADRYLAGRTGLRALSLGCGMGGREMRWAELGVFDHIDAFDLAPSAVEEARRRAGEAGYEDVIDFAVRDFTTLGADERYDVVLAEHSLHHFEPMPDVVAKVDEILLPGGLFLVDEYVGPQRFQWTERQVAEAQAVLERLPERFRRIGPGEIKQRVIRPSRLWMVLTDPSEAVDSARITSTLYDRFEVLEERPYGGAVLHLALSDIAQNFLDDADPETAAVLAEAFMSEDQLMEAGAIESDFAAFVCAKRTKEPA